MLIIFSNNLIFSECLDIFKRNIRQIEETDTKFYI